MQYPTTAPINVPIVAKVEFLYALPVFNSVIVRKYIGVGRGRNEASARAHRNNDHVPHFVVAQVNTQFENDLNLFFLKLSMVFLINLFFISIEQCYLCLTLTDATNQQDC